AGVLLARCGRHQALPRARGPDARNDAEIESSRGGWGMSANHRDGHRNANDKKVRVAIVGVGNCASSLVQGVHYYRDASPKDSVPGLMHVDLGGYHIRDIDFVAAFDIDKNKVGLDLSEAIDAKPNNTVKFADVPRTGVRVQRVLTRLFRDRGVKLERTYQLNFGGNTDFLNMLERERLMSKKISKTRSVTSQLDYDIGKDNVHIGPSDYVPWLNDRKWVYIRLEGRSFGDV